MPIVELLALAGAFIAFTVSAAAGLGGSLVLVPLLILLLDTKTGIALAAAMLAANNVFKVVAYRKTIPLRASLLVMFLTMIGAYLGAQALAHASSELVDLVVFGCIVAAVLGEYVDWSYRPKVAAPAFALSSGLFSGFSGTSGPLKGIALRSLDLDRFYLVGAASCVSLVADATKGIVFWQAGVLDETVNPFLLLALPLMPIATWTGRKINQEIGERIYAGLFWFIMAGYSVRLFWA